MIRSCLLVLLLISSGCTAPPREQPLPELGAVRLELLGEEPLELRQVKLFSLRSGKQRRLRALPVEGDRYGIAWETVRRIEVAPRGDWREEEPGQLRAPLVVHTDDGPRELSVDAGPGHQELRLQGKDENGITVSLELLDCVRVERR